MSRALIIVALSLLAVAGVVVYAFANGDRFTFIPSDLAYEYESQFDRRQQLKQGWVLAEVKRNPDKPSRLTHFVEVSPETAGELLMLSNAQRRREVAEVACPKADAKIWESLSSSQDIEVEMVSDNGTFAVVGCRGQVL